ncbi:DUF537-domain-containing protein, partial [Violaceomyces palustris]
RDRTQDHPDPVAVFWDVDNCSPPTGSSGRAVAQAIRSSLQNLELGPIVSFKAYLELSSETHAPNAAQVQLRSELQGSGVSLIDTPKSGRKDVADKMMITDLLAYAIDQPAPATIVLISGDRDFAYPLGLLRNRGYKIVLITPPIGAVPILEASANYILTWRQDVLGVERASNGRLYSSAGGNGGGGVATPSKNPSSTLAHRAPSSWTPSSSNSAVSRKPSMQGREAFDPLIALLEQLKMEGNSKPLRASVASKLVALDRNVFIRAGATRWGEYAAVAQAAEIIELGSSGAPGTEWVSLRSIEQPPLPPTKSRGAHQLNESNSSAFPPTSSSSSSSTSSTSSSSSPAPGETNASNFSNNNATSSIKSASMKAFLPLIEIVKEQRSQGNPRPLCSYVGTQLSIMARQGLVDAYGLAGVNNWKEYIGMAERNGVARSVPSETEGVYAVELNPSYFNVQTHQIVPSTGRMLDTATTPTPLPSSSSSSSSPTKRGLFGFGSSSSNKKSPSLTDAYSQLSQILTDQKREGRNYSTDPFLQSILASQYRSVNVVGGGVSFNFKNSEQFNSFLDQASKDGVITIEPGFKPNVRHIRLDPNLVVQGKVPQANKMDEGEAQGRREEMHPTTPKANKRSMGLKTLFGGGSSNLHLASPSNNNKEPQTSTKLETRLERYLEEHVEDESDRKRFLPLLDTLVQLRYRENLPSPTKSKVKSEMIRRIQKEGPGGVGAQFQKLGARGFSDLVSQAREKGLVVVGGGEG